MNRIVPSLRLAAVFSLGLGTAAAAQPVPPSPPTPVTAPLAASPAVAPSDPAAPVAPVAPSPTATATAPVAPTEAPPLPPPPVFDPAAPPPTPLPPPTPVIGLRNAPRVLALSVGWSYTPSNQLPLTTASASVLTPQGVNVDARFGWQVGGYQSGWNSYVGFLASFFYYAGSNGVSSSLGLDYGIFAKHVLFPGRRVRLFVGYGLGAVQVWVNDVGGRGIGHMTRLSAGLETSLSQHVHLSFEFAYKFNVLPSFATDTATDSEPRSYDFHSLSLLGGLWFGK